MTRDEKDKDGKNSFIMQKFTDFDAPRKNDKKNEWIDVNSYVWYIVFLSVTWHIVLLLNQRLLKQYYWCLNDISDADDLVFLFFYFFPRVQLTE